APGPGGEPAAARRGAEAHLVPARGDHHGDGRRPAAGAGSAAVAGRADRRAARRRARPPGRLAHRPVTDRGRPDRPTETPETVAGPRRRSAGPPGAMTGRRTTERPPGLRPTPRRAVPYRPPADAAQSAHGEGNRRPRWAGVAARTGPDAPACRPPNRASPPP